MTFISWIMLLGLAALAIPILIHLINRRKPVIVEWGAMRFLQASHQSRRRHLLLENILLLALRCLALALIGLAMARPFLYSQSAIPWILVLPLALAAIVGLAMAFSAGSKGRRRRQWIAFCIGLIATALLISLIEHWIQGRRWLSHSGGEDIMLIIDGSASMTVSKNGRSNFDNAMEETRAVIKAADPGDAIGIVLAGPAPRILLRPTSDRAALLEALEPEICRPTAGALGAPEALNTATAIMAEYNNPAKKIILFTDGQALGWDTRNEARWRFLADRFKAMPMMPKVICRRFEFPDDYENAAVAGISTSRRIIGMDRPVTLDVKILNAGTKILPPMAVELSDNDRLIEKKYPAKELPPGGAEVVRFEYHFDRPGRHVLKARTAGDDALPLDNTLELVVDVLDTLPVLLVDGAPSERFFRGASAYTRIALLPGETQTGQKSTSIHSPTQAVDGLVAPTVKSATDMVSFKDLDLYKIVILLNVPRLPTPVIQRLGDFVTQGGGLLVAPGRRAESDAYNEWKAPDGRPLLPAMLRDRRQLQDSPVHFDLQNFKHPALQLVAESPHSDAKSVLIRAYWTLAPEMKDLQVRICGQFDNGAPAIVERQVGKGCVIMSALAFDNRDSNLTSLKCFVPFIHELVYYLATPVVLEANINPGADMVIQLPAGNALVKGSKVEVLTPSQQQRPATVERVGDCARIRFTETQEPGLYRVILPQDAGPATATNAETAAAMSFTVVRQPDESLYQPLTDADWEAVRRQVDIAVVDGKDDLLMAVKGQAPGMEIWKWLVMGALLALLAETAVARWMSQQRRVTSASALSSV